jgi:membrane associated rhomboid family serine protease
MQSPIPGFLQAPVVEVRLPLQPVRLIYGLIGVLVFVQFYVLTLSRNASSPFELSPYLQFYTDFANLAVAITQGEYYRLLTSTFLHADLVHLGFNCMALYAFGQEVESMFGSVRFGAVYFLGGVAGSVASYIITQGNSIGASGAVFAIFGALVAYYLHHRELYGQRAYDRLRSLGMVALINLGIGFITTVPGSPVRIDNAAHIGGAVGGFILGWFLSPRFEVRKTLVGLHWQVSVVDNSKPLQWWLASLVFGGVLILLTAFTVMARA